MKKTTNKTQPKIHELMTALYNKAINEKMQLKDIIAQAVQIGINYEEKLIKEGINIVFKTMNNK